MRNSTDATRRDFAQVPTRLLADLTSPDGPILTFVESDGRLHLNRAAVKARAAERHADGEMPAQVIVPPIIFHPAAATGTARQALVPVFNVKRGA
jgi:hypothetical protein